MKRVKMQKLVLAAIITCFGLFVHARAQDDSSATKQENTEISYSELRQLIDQGKVTDAIIWDDGWWVTGRLVDGEMFDTAVNPSTPIADRLVDAGVATKFARSATEEKLPLWLSVFFNIIPFMIFLAFIFFMLRFMKNQKKTDEFFKRLEETIRAATKND